MKAIVYERYGGPEQLELREIDPPRPRDDEILVRVRAVSLNGADAEMLTGRPIYGRASARGLLRPRVRVLGSDVAGIVTEVGRRVEGFAPGDPVLGDLFEHFGGLSEYVCAPARLWVRKPDDIGFVDASTLPQAGVLALQGVRDQVALAPGSEVLIVGAGGGVGAFAVQLAKRLGAAVTAVDNGGKADVLASLGADRFVDHTREDFLADGRRYRLILDAVAARPPGAYRRALEPGGACVVVGGSLGRLLWFVLYGQILRLLSDKRLGMLLWDRTPANIETVAAKCSAGEILPVIDGVYPLDQAAAAFRRLTERRANGKVVVEISDALPRYDPASAPPEEPKASQ